MKESKAVKLNKRFLSKIIFPQDKKECFLWKGTKNRTNYGIFWDGKRQALAHRFSYEFFYNRKIKEGLTIDHQCNVTLCVNPNHLKEMTLKENILKSLNSPTAVNHRKTHCKNGHEFNNENTMRYVKHYRYCRKCHAVSQSIRRKLKRKIAREKKQNA